MPGPWLLLATALTLALTLPGVPGGHAQPEGDPKEAEMVAEYYVDLSEVLRLLLERGDLQQLLQNLETGESESKALQPSGPSKRQHPGKREEEEEAEEGVEEEKEGGGAAGPHKRQQHPGPGENAATTTWPVVDVAPQKRQHPGRRSFWLGYTFTKRQHPGRRLVDPKAQRSWGEAEEGEEEEERELMPEKRQHPGKRALGGPCGLPGDCGHANVLRGLLDGLSRGQGAEKQQHPGRRAAWARETLEA